MQGHIFTQNRNIGKKWQGPSVPILIYSGQQISLLFWLLYNDVLEMWFRFTVFVQFCMHAAKCSQYCTSLVKLVWQNARTEPECFSFHHTRQQRVFWTSVTWWKNPNLENSNFKWISTMKANGRRKFQFIFYELDICGMPSNTDDTSDSLSMCINKMSWPA